MAPHLRLEDWAKLYRRDRSRPFPYLGDGYDCLKYRLPNSQDCDGNPAPQWMQAGEDPEELLRVLVGNYDPDRPDTEWEIGWDQTPIDAPQEKDIAPIDTENDSETIWIARETPVPPGWETCGNTRRRSDAVDIVVIAGSADNEYWRRLIYVAGWRLVTETVPNVYSGRIQVRTWKQFPA